MFRTIANTLLLTSALVTTAMCWADDEKAPRLSPLSSTDKQFLDKQVAIIDSIGRQNFGSGVHGDMSDIALLQRIIDGRLIAGDNAVQTQAAGAVLGKVLEKELGLVWQAYEDELGRSRALCVKGTKHCLFPTTMISRRMEAGASTQVSNIYDKAVNLIDPYIPDTHGFDGVKPDPEERPVWIKDPTEEKQRTIPIKIQ